MTLDLVTLGLVSSRLYSLLNEQQSTLVRTAFSPVVRESLDLACALFDSRGTLIAQSTGGTPGHINAMATGMRHIVASGPAATLSDGDVLMTNDPWMTAGQINDITVATPVFRDRRLVGWFASCCHSPDIGGRLLSAEASEVYEEGLRIPVIKLRSAAGPDRTLEALIRANVRTPDETMGDMYAQVSANEVGARGLLRLMEQFSLDGLEAVGTEITSRSEAALRSAIRNLPDGVYCASAASDGYDDQPVHLRVSVSVEGDRVIVDYAGSSPQVPRGINVVLNYTRAYTSFAIKAALAPTVPHNAGSFRPVEVTAPVGSVLNCTDPAPVAARHVIGHFLPSLLFEALRPVLPDSLPASSSDALWMSVLRGGSEARDTFTLTMFGAGGSGARVAKDGLSATGFPTGVRAAPTEVMESLSTIVQVRRQLRADSGGAGRQRGGLGQVVELRTRGATSWTINANADRVDHPAPGADGGHSGANGALERWDSGGAGSVASSGLPRKRLVRLNRTSAVRLSLPGGGGHGDPWEREPQAVLSDVVDGYVSLEAAQKLYGLVIRYRGSQAAVVRLPVDYEIDLEATRRLRDRAR